MVLTAGLVWVSPSFAPTPLQYYLFYEQFRILSTAIIMIKKMNEINSQTKENHVCLCMYLQGVQWFVNKMLIDW